MNQLNLFKGRRQRGERPPSPHEFALHCALADLVTRTITPGWKFTHIPLGEKRDAATAGRLKRMGVQAGWPDFIFVGPGRVFFIELKRRGASRSDVQANIALHLMRCGCGYLCTDDLQDAIDTLRDLGVVRVSVSA
jgi:hypothetical protein